MPSIQIIIKIIYILYYKTIRHIEMDEDLEDQQEKSLDGREGRKMLKVDNPMAQLEKKLVDQIKRESQSDEDHQISKINILFQEKVQLTYKWLHYYPESCTKTLFTGPINPDLFQNGITQIQIQACQIIQSNQSLLYHSYNQNSSQDIIKYLCLKCNGLQKRVILVRRSERQCYGLYSQLIDCVDVTLCLQEGSLSSMPSGCIISTIEELKRMVYSNNSQLQGIDWVILQQFSQMDHQEYGYQLEEILITLPLSIRLLLLNNHSINNSQHIAHWLSSIRNAPFNIILSTHNQQPIPQEYLCALGGDEIVKINNQPSFESKNTGLMNLLIKKSLMDDKKKLKLVCSNVMDSVKSLIEMGVQPIVILSEGKKEIELLARSIVIKYDLTSKQQKDRIDFMISRIGLLFDEQQKTQGVVVQFHQILRKGIAIYHEGLLPILQDLVQMLCQQSLIKVIVSNSSFLLLRQLKISAIITSAALQKSYPSSEIQGGLKLRQMPYKRKVQICKIREYLLMNSTTHNHDTHLVHVIAYPQQLIYLTAKGQSSKQLACNQINSRYKMDLNMVLAHTTFQDMDSEYIFKRTFKLYQYRRNIERQRQEQLHIQQQYKVQMNQPHHQFYKKTILLEQNLNQLQQQYKVIIQKPQILIPFLTIGRILYLKHEGQEWGYGVLVNFHKKQLSKKERSEECTYLLDCFVFIKEENGVVRCCKKYEESTHVAIITFTLSAVQYVMSTRIILPNDLNTQHIPSQISKTLAYLKSNMEMPRLTFEQSIPSIKALQAQISQLHQQYNATCLPENRQSYANLKSQSQSLNAIKQTSNQQKQMKKQLKSYRKLAKYYNLIEKRSLTTKGMYIQKLDSFFNVLLIQLINTQSFQSLPPEELIGVMSVFIQMKQVATVRGKVAITVIRTKIDEILKVAKQMAKVYVDCKIIIEEEQYLQRLKEGYVEAIYEWSKGLQLMDICTKHQIFQGNLHRFITATIHLLSQMQHITKMLQNQQLSDQYSNCINLLSRSTIAIKPLYAL